MYVEHKPAVQRAGAWLYALASAVLVLIAFRPHVRPLSLLMIFVVAWILARLVWGWVLFERSAELDGKIPISSKELRKRKKQFFDSLPRQ